MNGIKGIAWNSGHGWTRGHILHDGKARTVCGMEMPFQELRVDETVTVDCERCLERIILMYARGEPVPRAVQEWAKQYQHSR